MAEKEYFGPLTLHQMSETTVFNRDKSEECSCPLCELKVTLPAEEKQLLTHLFMKHRLVIADVNDIYDLKAYLNYWRLRFKDESLAYFCTTMLLDEQPDGTKSKDEEYFLLSDVLPEEKELRMNLEQTRLEDLMKRHQFERDDKNYERECLFCRFTSRDTRSCYLNHLYEKHNFHIAKPENLVFIDQLIDLIAEKLDKLQCIFCEKYFKDRTILKEHMRKKGHKRINPDNKEYDKFYLVNYTHKKNEYKPKNAKTGYRKPYVKPCRSEDHDSNVDSDPDWSDWTEENSQPITCLICSHTESDYNTILDHMERIHNFSFTQATLNLDFYHKIKIVNYLRRQIHLKKCISCDTKFDENLNLEKHMRESNHIVLSKEKWDQPEYYFPTYEDDLFLCFIQDDDESWWSSDEGKDPQKSKEQEVERRNSMTDCISKEVALAVLDE